MRLVILIRIYLTKNGVSVPFLQNYGCLQRFTGFTEDSQEFRSVLGRFQRLKEVYRGLKKVSIIFREILGVQRGLQRFKESFDQF